MGEVFAHDLPLRPMLLRIYGIALDMYLSGKDGPRGCFTVMTATSEAVFDPEIRAMVVTGLVEMDRFFARLFRIAQERGELGRFRRSAGAGATGVGDHPHHRDPRPRPGPAGGTRSHRQRRDRCDVAIARGVQYPRLRSTTFSSAPPASKRSIWRATYFDISSGSVSAALCGVSTTFLWVQNGLSDGNGSVA